jgi:hypothetical protein
MKKSPLDPNAADLAPTDPAVTTYDEEHLITYLRLLDADADEPTGAMSRGSSCILTRTATPTARGERSKATSRAPDG